MVRAMPVEFLSDQEAAAYGSYGASVSQADLESFFYLDDADRRLLAKAKLRGDHNRLEFSVQLATVRHLGRFLSDPLEGMPTEVIDFLAGQLGVADPSCVKRYARREPTHREHARTIQEALGLRDFIEVEADLAAYVARRAWITGDGPKAIFFDALRWLREQQRRELDALLAVPAGKRISQLEEWRTGPARASGPQMVKALSRVAEIISSGLSRTGHTHAEDNR